MNACSKQGRYLDGADDAGARIQKQAPPGVHEQRRQRVARVEARISAHGGREEGSREDDAALEQRGAVGGRHRRGFIQDGRRMECKDLLEPVGWGKRVGREVGTRLVTW
jgi:hypothetical protein